MALRLLPLLLHGACAAQDRQSEPAAAVCQDPGACGASGKGGAPLQRAPFHERLSTDSVLFQRESSRQRSDEQSGQSPRPLVGPNIVRTPTPPPVPSLDMPWTQSLKSGYKDAKGQWVGGSEIAQMAAFQGKLYAINDYVMDPSATRNSQVLRLDSSDAQWQVDLDAGKAIDYKNVPGAEFAYATRGTLLKTIHVANMDLLVAAVPVLLNKGGLWGIAVHMKLSDSAKWKSTIVLVRGGDANTETPPVSPHGIEVYTDPRSQEELIFLLVGNYGVIEGIYHSGLNDFIWSQQAQNRLPESFPTPAMGIAQKITRLYFSTGGEVYFRLRNGAWRKEYERKGAVDARFGGLRGLTPVEGNKFLCIWSPDASSVGQVMALGMKAVGMVEHDEATLRKLWQDYTKDMYGAGSLTSVVGVSPDFYRFTHPQTKRDVWIFGFAAKLGADAHRNLTWTDMYAGAPYALRFGPSNYAVGEVGGRYTTGSTPLVAARTFVLSPFPGEEDVLYVAGFDANRAPAVNTAWIYKAGLNTVLSGARSVQTECRICSTAAGEKPLALNADTIAGRSQSGFRYSCAYVDNWLSTAFMSEGECEVAQSLKDRCCREVASKAAVARAKARVKAKGLASPTRTGSR